MKGQNMYLAFGSEVIYDDAEFSIEEKDKVGVVGVNGAGKTTLFKIILKEERLDGGKVTIHNKKIGYLPQEIDLYPGLTVQECLEYMGDLSGVPKEECRKRIRYYLEKTSLTEHRKKKMRQLSGGMKRRVGLVQALLNDPKFLIVDEPTTGLDPEERIRIRNLLVDFSENRTVLFSTHVVEDLAAVCNQLAVMKKGQFLYAGSIKELLKEAKGHVWVCQARDEVQAREIERKYHISSKQLSEEGVRIRLINEKKPDLDCISVEPTLEDAYIFISGQNA